jgi:polysaccharide biosynthesis transport protein
MNNMSDHNRNQDDRGGAIIARQNQGDLPGEYRQDSRPYPYFHIEEEQQATQSFDFYKYLRILTKYRWLIIGTTLMALLLASAATYLITPVYRATARIQIDRETMNVVGKDNLQQDAGNVGVEFYQTQYELLGSRSLAERVSSTLALNSDATFQSKNNASLLGIINDLIFGPKKEVAKDSATFEEKNIKIIETLRRTVSVSPIRGSKLVDINVDHVSPAVAQRIATGYAEVFIADNLDRRYDASSYARKFLEERIQQLKIKLEDSEKQLVVYAEQQGIITLDDKKTLAGTDLESINSKLADARNERQKREAVWRQAQETQGFGLQQILDSDAVKSNRKLRTELAAEYQQKLALFKPAFPAMAQLRNQIKELDRQVQTEVEAIKGSIKAQYDAALSQEQELETALVETKSEVVDQRNRSIQYNILQREVDTNRTLYDGLLQRYKEIGVTGAVGTNNISVVDKASLPTSPRSPKLLLNLALGLISGLLLGLLTALGLDYLDDSFKVPEDIEREVGLPVLGVSPVPISGLSVDEELLDARSAASEAVRSLRTGLQFATSQGLPKTLLITSSKPSEGKTTTSISLARSLAQIGMNVLLIDGDLRNASVHKRMSCSNEFGLSNYLIGSKMPDDVVQGTNTEGLVVMTAGPLPPNPAELIAGPRMMSLLALGAESFDIVVIDGPPIMGLADAPLLSSQAQSTLLVVAANETRRSVVKVALRRLNMARASVIGALLTKFNAKQSGYGYGYGYGEYEYHSYGAKELPAPNR